MNRSITLLIIVVAIILPNALFAIGRSESKGDKDYIEYEVVARISKDRVPASRPTYFEQELINRFGMKWNYQDIPQDSYEQKIMLLVTAGDKIDYFQLGGGVDATAKLALEGYLKPIDEYIHKMPNYRAMFTDQQWEEAYTKRAMSDGVCYIGPAPPTSGGNMVAEAWIYKKSAWEELGLPLPKTVEELADQLEIIKQHYPDSIGISTRQDNLNDFMRAFRTDDDFYIDYDLTDGTELTYGPATNKYRDLLIFCNDLYARGLVDPEFPTVNKQKWAENMARGIGFADFDWPSRAPWAEDLEKATNPNVDWDALPYWLSSEKYPGGPVALSTTDFSQYGETHVIIPAHLEGEKLDRLLKYLDWTVTKEGNIFSCYGIEGVTFEYMDDGTPRLYSYQFIDLDGNIVYDKKDIIDPYTGKKVDFAWQMGFPPGSPDICGPILQSPLNMRETKEYIPLNALVRSNSVDFIRDRFWNIVWRFTPEEERQKKDLKTVVDQVRNAYIIKFIIGELDPGNDADWNEFQKELKNANLDKLLELQNKVMARVPANLVYPKY